LKTAILIDNMYLQNLKNEYGVDSLDPSRFSAALLRPGEVHYMTYIFDAEPYVPKEEATDEQIELRSKKKDYLEAIQQYERIKVELGYVAPKLWKCPQCGETFTVPVQKQVDVKISVRLMSLAWERVAEKIVLLCGDGDVLPAVRAVEPTGTIVRLVYVQFGRVKASRALIRECPEKMKLTRECLELMTFKP
jgi:uncharacterized LabA/DUF88 family protein